MVSMTLPQLRRHECTIDGRVVKLRHTLAELLALLLVSGPKFLSRDDLIEALWPNPDFEPEWAETIIHLRIHELRAHGVEIESAYKFGYRVNQRQANLAEAA